ncbi:hypothetical protein [Dokdonella sp.]|uniref:hypothetical protein n=1 Tax=Dokdonella sp. TaxID=2291710 RepID=UPI0031C6F27F|nr:hypothetical protein [Dokdonella sp.]
MERDATHTLPADLRDFFTISEVDDAHFLAGALFRRKFAAPPPDAGRHLVALYRDPAGSLHVAGYSHMRRFGEVYLSGGSCSEGATIRAMTPAHRDAIQAAGGVWYLVLKYAFERYADCCDAFFGHCGDRRALEVATAAGFVAAGPEHLIVHWHKPLHPVIRRALIAKVEALGPF